MPEFCLATSKADYIVMGEGEETIVEFMIKNSSEKDKLKEVQGLGYKFKNEIFINPRRQRITDLDEIALPDWKSFI